VPRTAGQSAGGKAAGVAKAVKDLVHIGQGPHFGAVVALVEIKPGLVTVHRIDREAQAFFVHDPGQDLPFAVDQPLCGRQTFQREDVGVGALIHLRRAGAGHQGRHNRLAPARGAGGEQLQHQ
jgi:hypothetical protein